jgi:hypothetical protein
VEEEDPLLVLISQLLAGLGPDFFQVILSGAHKLAPTISAPRTSAGFSISFDFPKKILRIRARKSAGFIILRQCC